MQSITIKERFSGLSNGHQHYAPLSLGVPQYTEQVDYTVFKKTLKEKIKTENIKRNHKREMVRFYGKGKIGRNLNISSQ